MRIQFIKLFFQVDTNKKVPRLEKLHKKLRQKIKNYAKNIKMKRSDIHMKHAKIKMFEEKNIDRATIISN